MDTTTAMYRLMLLLILLSPLSECLVPPKFQWNKIDFAWLNVGARDMAIASGDYVPENNMPTGLARWKDKLFIAIPRWKSGIPASLNYINLLNSTCSKQDSPLHPYPSWPEAFISKHACCVSSNETVVSAFKVTVDDQCKRLWVVDNGVIDMYENVKQIAPPSIMVFDLETDCLIHKHELGKEVLKSNSILSSIVVDTPASGKDRCARSFAYITDMGSNAVIAYDMREKNAWRVENKYFEYDPKARKYNVGGVEFDWTDGVSSATLSARNSDGFRDFYFHPTSSTKLYKISTKYLQTPCYTKAEILEATECVGEKGPMTQATSCFYDPHTDIVFYTLVNKNAIGCWNTYKPFNAQNTPIIFSDCNLLEFPNDLTVDEEGNIWILSNRQARFLSSALDFNSINFRVLTAPVEIFTQGTPCAKLGCFSKMFTRKPKSARSTKSKEKIICCHE